MEASDIPPVLAEKSLEWLEFWPENDFKVESDLNMNSSPFGWVQSSDQLRQGPGSADPAAPSAPPTSDSALLYQGQSHAVSAALLGQFSEVSSDGKVSRPAFGLQ